MKAPASRILTAVGADAPDPLHLVYRLKAWTGFKPRPAPSISPGTFGALWLLSLRHGGRRIGAPAAAASGLPIQHSANEGRRQESVAQETHQRPGLQGDVTTSAEGAKDGNVTNSPPPGRCAGTADRLPRRCSPAGMQSLRTECCRSGVESAFRKYDHAAMPIRPSVGVAEGPPEVQVPDFRRAPSALHIRAGHSSGDAGARQSNSGLSETEPQSLTEFAFPARTAGPRITRTDRFGDRFTQGTSRCIQ